MTGPSTKPNDSAGIFRLYELLDRYEELIEDMRELEITSLDQAEAKIAALNEQIDEAEANGESSPS
jgi:hypothetical protein